MSAGYGNNRRGGQNSYNRKKTEKSKIVDKQSYDDFKKQLPFLQRLKDVGPKVDANHGLSTALYLHFQGFSLGSYMYDSDWNNRDIMKYYDCMKSTKSALVNQIGLYRNGEEYDRNELLMACGSWLMGSFIIGVKPHHQIMTAKTIRN